MKNINYVWILMVLASQSSFAMELHESASEVSEGKNGESESSVSGIDVEKIILDTMSFDQKFIMFKKKRVFIDEYFPKHLAKFYENIYNAYIHGRNIAGYVNNKAITEGYRFHINKQLVKFIDYFLMCKKSYDPEQLIVNFTETMRAAIDLFGQFLPRKNSLREENHSVYLQLIKSLNSAFKSIEDDSVIARLFQRTGAWEIDEENLKTTNKTKKGNSFYEKFNNAKNSINGLLKDEYFQSKQNTLRKRTADVREEPKDDDGGNNLNVKQFRRFE